MQENELRPKTLEDILGQEEVVERLNISVQSASQRDDAMPHMLFYGPPGLGKTTLSMAIANTRGTDIQVANAGNITSVKKIVPYLMKIQENSILFIDEVHRLPVQVEEFLYPVMEDFRMDTGEGSDQLSLDIPKFTMIGATTEAGSLSRPFLDRYSFKYELKLYSVDHLADIVIKTASSLSLFCEKDAAIAVAKRSRGTPRVANNIMLWLRDVVTAMGGSDRLTAPLVGSACTMTGIDENGVTEQDRTYLEALKKCGKPMGLRTIVDTTNIDKDTIQNIIEPFLLRQGLIQRTTKGRILV